MICFMFLYHPNHYITGRYLRTQSGNSIQDGQTDWWADKCMKNAEGKKNPVPMHMLLQLSSVYSSHVGTVINQLKLILCYIYFIPIHPCVEDKLHNTVDGWQEGFLYLSTCHSHWDHTPLTEYIPWNMHTGFLWVFFPVSWSLQMIYKSIFLRVASMALGHLYDNPTTTEITLKDMGKIY